MNDAFELGVTIEKCLQNRCLLSVGYNSNLSEWLIVHGLRIVHFNIILTY